MIKPIGKNILIQKQKREEKQGSLILASNRDNEPYQAMIMEKGSKVESEIEKGDLVLVNPYRGTKINQYEDQYLLITEMDILGVLS